MNRKHITKWLGNGLIALSLFGFSFTLFPLIQVYFFPKKIDVEMTSKGEYIVIPKISAQAKIIENVDPFNQGEYEKALEEGVAHAKNTSKPGENGMVYLFAHSSGMPWEITRNNAPFLRLDELNKNDSIEITKEKKRYIYLVYDKKVVWPNEVEYLLSQSKNTLILQTCTPIGTSLQRLLIFAKLQAA